MSFLGIHITNNGIATSKGDVITEPSYFYKLFELCNGHTPVFYDLDAAVASLLHLIECNKADAQKLLRKETLWLAPYILTYFPKRFFSIDYGGGGKNHPYLNFANMNQMGYHDAYYTEGNPLQDAVNKAKEAEETAIAVDLILCKLGLPNSSLTSPSSTFLKKFNLKWPTMDDCPDEVTELAKDGVMGQWFESFKLGAFEPRDFDINGSYLYELSKLPDIRNGKWIQARTPPDTAILGIAKGTLDTEAPFHPFIVKINKYNYTPIGRFPAILTLQALQFLKRWNLGTFQVDEGWWWIPQNHYEIYKGAMMFLWKARQGTSGRERLIIQRIYSSLVGKQLEHFDTKGFGDMFNPIIGLTVEVNSRLHVAEACMQSNIIPLAVMADGFITDTQIDLPLNTELGSWRLSAKGKCIIAGTGMVAFQENTSATELGLDYASLCKQVKENPEATEYLRSTYLPITLALALEQGFSKLGEVQLIERSLNIGTENKRMYPSRPRTGRDLLNNTWNSMPRDYNELT